MSTLSTARPRRRALARWCTAAGVAAVVSALTLTACDRRDGAPAAAANPAQTMTAAPAGTALAPADAARAGTPVPTAQVPAAALAPAPAVAPPPVNVAQATPAQSNGAGVAPPMPASVGAAVDDPPRSGPAAVPATTRVAQAPAPSGRMGSVESIEPIRQRPPGTGAGAVIGGVAGAVIGNQFGHGLGRAAMTGLGAAGGAVAGNNVERNVRKQIVGYRVHVRLDNGRTRTFERSQIGNLHVGDRIRVDGNGFRRA